jgi:hypothetical protein
MGRIGEPSRIGRNRNGSRREATGAKFSPLVILPFMIRRRRWMRLNFLLLFHEALAGQRRCWSMRRRNAAWDDYREVIKDGLSGRAEITDGIAWNNRLCVELLLYQYRSGIACRYIGAVRRSEKRVSALPPLSASGGPARDVVHLSHTCSCSRNAFQCGAASHGPRLA